MGPVLHSSPLPKWANVAYADVVAHKTPDPKPRDHSAHQDKPAGTDVAPAPETTAEVDVLAPWGAAGPAPSGVWRTDVLGGEFESRTIGLEPDSEGDNVATIVRLTSSLPPAQNHEPHTKRDVLKGLKRLLRQGEESETQTEPTFAVLYIHGRNDYFFHAEAAAKMAGMGAAFYALDLRKHGRSLRPGQTIGYATDLAVYDREIGLALGIIAEECPGLPVVLMAHSTGGLIATLWAHRNPGRLAGLILNSAWLELQVYPNMRPAIHQLTSRVGAIRPHATIIGVSKTDSYFRSLASGWQDSGLEIPSYFLDFPEDPAFVGWEIAPEWKWPFSYAAPAAWVAAVLEGHATVEKDVHLDIPVLAMASTDSGLDFAWSEKVFSSDVVLDADAITGRAAKLSDSVTIIRLPGKHDLLLSDPPVREDLYRTIQGWLKFSGITDPC